MVAPCQLLLTLLTILGSALRHNHIKTWNLVINVDFTNNNAKHKTLDRSKAPFHQLVIRPQNHINRFHLEESTGRKSKNKFHYEMYSVLLEVVGSLAVPGYPAFINVKTPTFAPITLSTFALYIMWEFIRVQCYPSVQMPSFFRCLVIYLSVKHVTYLVNYGWMLKNKKV